jgi:hypothetical protein
MKIKIAVSLCSATLLLSACGSNDTVVTSPEVEAVVKSPTPIVRVVDSSLDDIPAFDPDIVVGHWKNSDIPVLNEKFVVKVSTDCYESHIKNINENVLDDVFVLEKFCFDYGKGLYKGTRQRTRFDGNNIVEHEWMVSEGVNIQIQDGDKMIKQIMDSNRDFKMDFFRVE